MPGSEIDPYHLHLRSRLGPRNQARPSFQQRLQTLLRVVESARNWRCRGPLDHSGQLVLLQQTLRGETPQCLEIRFRIRRTNVLLVPTASHKEVRRIFLNQRASHIHRGRCI